MKKSIFLITGVLFILASCSSGQDEKDQQVSQIIETIELPAKELEKADAKPLAKIFQKEGSTQTKDGLTVEMYHSADSLDMRYNPIYFRILNKDGTVVTNAGTHLETFMGMGDNGHGSPVLQPEYDPQTQLYSGGIVFSMPGTWEVKLAISNGQYAEFPVKIGYPKGSETLMEADNGSDDNFYNVSLMSPRNWVQGENKFSILVNLMKEDMVSFPTVDGLDISLHPINTIDGTNSNEDNSLDTKLSGTGNGIYSGTVNLPQQGLWNLNFELKKGDSILIKEMRLVVGF